MQALEQMLEKVLDKKLEPIYEEIGGMKMQIKVIDKKLDKLNFKMDMVYNWVDGIDVRELKKG